MGVIETACWRVGYAGVLPQPVLEGLDESIRAKRWQRILRRAGSEAWVAQNLEGRILGFTALGLPSEEWEDEPDAQDEHRVRSLFVAPPYWRLGLGSKLLKWAEEQTVVLGGQHILARVPRDAAGFAPSTSVRATPISALGRALGWSFGCVCDVRKIA